MEMKNWGGIMSDVIILDYLKETTDERFRKFIIAECRRIDRLDVYNWVADDELKIKQLQQENKQLKEVINKAKLKSIYLQERYGYILDDLTFLLSNVEDNNER